MELARRSANIIAALAQAAVPALGYAGLLGKTVDADYQTITTPVVPATYAFIIWSVIFVLSILYAFDQARPVRTDDPLYHRIGWLTAIAFAANAVWGVVAQLELPLPLTGVVFLFCVFTIIPAAIILYGGEQVRRDRWAANLSVGLLAGWVSVAIFANWSVILKDAGLGEVPGETIQALIFLSGAGLLAAFTLMRTGGALTYLVAVLWALVAVVIVNLQRGMLTIAVGASVWIIFLSGLAWLRRRRPA